MCESATASCEAPWHGLLLNQPLAESWLAAWCSCMQHSYEEVLLRGQQQYSGLQDKHTFFLWSMASRCKATSCLWVVK